MYVFPHLTQETTIIWSLNSRTSILDIIVASQMIDCCFKDVFECDKCKTIMNKDIENACLVMELCKSHWCLLYTWHVGNLEKPVYVFTVCYLRSMPVLLSRIWQRVSLYLCSVSKQISVWILFSNIFKIALEGYLHYPWKVWGQ